MQRTSAPFDVEPHDEVAEPIFEIGGNRLRFVQHPEDRWNAIIRLIESAEQSIRAFYYMIADDESGEGLIDALCEARARGVEVSLGIDSFGSGDTPEEWFDRAKECGIEFFCFSSRRSVRYLIRNHQKMLIIDGKSALVGGYNIRDSYFWKGNERSWEDLGVIVEGDRVTALCRYYDDFREIATGGHARLHDVRKLLKRWLNHDGALAWTFGGPTLRLSPWALRLKRDLEGAERASIVSAYFSPGRAMIRRIGKIAKRGGNLTLLLASKSDSHVTINASRLLYKYFTKRGAKIYEYLPRCLHMKLVVIDDVSYVGSANMDPRSLFLNCELMLRIEDREVAEHLRRLIERMKGESEEQTMSLIRERSGPVTKVKNAFSYLAVGVIDYTVTRKLSLPFRKGRSG